MSEFRWDAFTGSWILLSPNRAGLGATRPGGLPTPSGPCPFCPGNEGETEPTVFALGDPWRIRVVRNRFPMVTPNYGIPLPSKSRAGSGIHELVLETPRHDGDLASLSDQEAIELVWVWRERIRFLEGTEHVQSISLFRNRGRRAGSSQPHPHTQIAAIPVVPQGVRLRAHRARTAETHQRTLLQRVLRREFKTKERILFHLNHVVAWCPFASQRAWEVRIAMEKPCPRFSLVDDFSLESLAIVLRNCARLVLSASGATDYNVVLRDPPVRWKSVSHGFFSIDLLPRTGGDAGFELWGGEGVCVVEPERAAAVYREAWKAEENARAKR